MSNQTMPLKAVLGGVNFSTGFIWADKHICIVHL